MTKTETKRKRTVVVVDDHPILRRGIIQLINDDPGLTVVGEAEDVTGAMKVLTETTPEAVVVDITLRDSSGIDLIREIADKWPDVPVLVFSMHDESLYAERVLRAGARGYVMKSAPTERIDPSRPSGSRRRNRRGSPDHQPRVNADGDRKPCRRGVAHRTAH